MRYTLLAFSLVATIGSMAACGGDDDGDDDGLASSSSGDAGRSSSSGGRSSSGDAGRSSSSSGGSSGGRSSSSSSGSSSGTTDAGDTDAGDTDAGDTDAGPQPDGGDSLEARMAAACNKICLASQALDCVDDPPSQAACVSTCESDLDQKPVCNPQLVADAECRAPYPSSEYECVSFDPEAGPNDGVALIKEGLCEATGDALLDCIFQ